MIYIENIYLKSKYNTQYNVYSATIRFGYQNYCFIEDKDLLICSDYLNTCYIRISQNTHIYGQNNLRALFVKPHERILDGFILTYGSNIIDVRLFLTKGFSNKIYDTNKKYKYII